MEADQHPLPTWDAAKGVSSAAPECCFSMRLIEVEPLTAPPVAGLDEMWNTLDAKPIKKVPLLRLYGATPAGQKCSVTVHNAYPYFFVNIPESVLQQHDTYEKLAGYATQLAHALNRATQLNLASKSLDAQYIHMISVVQAKPFYGYSPDHELYFKIFLFVLNYRAETSFLPFKSHFQIHFYL